MAIRWRIDPRSLADLRLLVGLTLPAAAGLTVFGWRVVGVWCFILMGTWLGRFVLARLRTWQDNACRSRAIADVLLLSLFFPATLFDLDPTNLRANANWPALIGMGVLLALFQWFCRRLHIVRVHAVVLTLVTISLAMPQLFQTDRVLTRAHVLGDILDERVEPRAASAAEPWLSSDAESKTRVYVITPAEVRLDYFLHGRPSLDRSTQTIARLVSDELPPLEDLVIGGHPRPIGCASAIALLSGGLFLIYRGYVTWRVPTLMLLSIYAGLMLAPVPTVVGDHTALHRSILLTDPRIGSAMAITFANYLLAASPLLLVSLFLATHREHRPRGMVMICFYAIFFGLLAGLATALVSVDFGAIFALLIVQILGSLIGGLSARLCRRRGHA